MSYINTTSKNFDEQETNILKDLDNGNKREDIYKKYGYSSIRTMDAFFRRRGFIVKNGQYIKRDAYRDQMLNQISDQVPFKAQMIAEKFKKDGMLANPAEIASTFGFENYTEMNNYMRKSNMFYNSSTRTYEPRTNKRTNALSEFADRDAKIEEVKQLVAKDDSKDDESKYYSFLNYLYENREQLIELCTPSLTENTPQRYLIPGSKKVKSIYLSKGLSTIIDDFSRSKNITIREMVEGAMIEYLIKYGYRSEVEILLSKK